MQRFLLVGLWGRMIGWALHEQNREKLGTLLDLWSLGGAQLRPPPSLLPPVTDSQVSVGQHSVVR